MIFNISSVFPTWAEDIITINPIKLVEKRTTAFWNRKKIKVSTPTIKGISQVEKEFESGINESSSALAPRSSHVSPSVVLIHVFKPEEDKSIDADDQRNKPG